MRTLLILNGLLLPLSGFAILTLANGFGMGPAFVDTLTVENRTSEPLTVTPVGTFRAHPGPRHLLPILFARVPAIPAMRHRDFVVAPGGSVVIHYDDDDHVITEIVVWNSAGRTGQIATASARRFVVADLASLPAPRSDVLAAARESDPGPLFLGARRGRLGGAADLLHCSTSLPPAAAATSSLKILRSHAKRRIFISCS